MSATPRPWNDLTRIEQIRHRWGRSWVEITQDQDVTHDAVEDTRWLLNAFAALLAVAKAAHHNETYSSSSSNSADLNEKLGALDSTHPDWREWKS